MGRASVTAILVVDSGWHRLGGTVTAIVEQLRRVDRLVVVGEITDQVMTAVASAAPARVVQLRRGTIGDAVDRALAAIGPAEDDEWLWVLTADTAPHPAALRELLAAVELAPSVVVAGPKLIDPDDHAMIVSFGESVSRLGSTVRLVENELDQAQFDRDADVLAVAVPGMIIRRSAWTAVGGTDPVLARRDDGLDLCIRVRLAGGRVIRVPRAMLEAPADPLAARSAATRRRANARDARRAQLHRRLVYASPIAVLLHWLTLAPLTVLRILWMLVTKRPWAVAGELSAAVAAALSLTRVGTARRRLARAKRRRWSSIRPLRVPTAELWERRGIAAEARAEARSVPRERPDFLSGGGAFCVAIATVFGVVVVAPLVGSGAISGGGLLPLSGSVAQLWSAFSGDLGADPFAIVLAVLGTLTFWSPSFSIVALYALAVPLAALGGWWCAARLVTRPWPTAVASLLWALAPTFLIALADGRIGAVVLHLMLPWLILTGIEGARSWTAAAAASLFFAVAVAASPSLAPLLLLVWLAWLGANVRRVPRLIAIPVPALVLFAPIVVAQLGRGTPLALLADPGLPRRFDAPAEAELVLGLPRGGVNGWSAAAASLGLPPWAVAAALLLPLAALLVVATIHPAARRAYAPVTLAILGLAGAASVSGIAVAVDGIDAVAVWPGAALSVYWLGLLGAGAVALESLSRLKLLAGVSVLVGGGLVAAPLVLAPLSGSAAVSASESQLAPAIVAAEAEARPWLGTLELAIHDDGVVEAGLVRGAGATLDAMRTLDSTRPHPDELQQLVAQLAGHLITRSGVDAGAQLRELGIEFVLVRDSVHGPSAARDRAIVALDADPALVEIGESRAGQLWRTADPAIEGRSADAVGPATGLVRSAQAGVIAIAILLAIPTARRARRTERTTIADSRPATTFDGDDDD